MTNKSNTTKHACYSRIGSFNAGSAGDELNSLDQQVQSMSRFCLLKGWNNFIVYMDAGYSANNFDRPAFKQMIADIKEGKIRTVLATTTDRLSRSIVPFANFLSILKDNNVQFISVEQNIDLSKASMKTVTFPSKLKDKS